MEVTRLPSLLTQSLHLENKTLRIWFSKNSHKKKDFLYGLINNKNQTKRFRWRRLPPKRNPITNRWG